MSKYLLCILSIIMATVVLIGCGGGGGGSKGGNDLNKLISTASKTVSGDTNTEIGDLSANGISLNLAKNSVEAGGKVTINQYSNIAAATRLSQQYPALASFTAISSLYDMSATDKNGKKVSTLNNPSELSIAISEDISSEKLYFAAIKQNDNWDLTPLSTSTNASYRAAVSQSKTVKITVNTVFESLFIVAAPKTNIPSKLTYAEAFYFSVNGSTTTPQTIAASYIQKFDDDIEVNIRLTLKGGLAPDKADMTLTAIQNGNKTIGIRKTDKSYKDMTFTSTDETGKYKGSVKLDSSLATISMAGDTATYTFYIKAKDIAVSDMPSTLILRASITGSKPFYSSDIQINFAKGPDRVANNVKMTTPSTTSDVATNTTVVLNFDQPVKIDSGKEAVLIPVTTDGNTVKADYSFSNSNKTLTIKFSENLAFNTKYTVSIKSGIQSENIKYKDVTPIDFVFTTGARRYTITFDGNGNTSGSVPMEKDSFLSKATYTLPATTDLVKTGYKFSCWNTKADGTGNDYALGSAITFATSDIVLYAKWDKTYTITFDGNGSTSGSVPTVKDVFLSKATYTLPTDVVLYKKGYSFIGWNTKTDGSGITYNQGANVIFVDADVILYAKWEACDFDGGSGTSVDPYLIVNAEQLNKVRNYSDKCFKQNADIDLGSWLAVRTDLTLYPSDSDSNNTVGWLPIPNFTGVYDGNNKEITGIWVNKYSNYAGVFAFIDSATVKNLKCSTSGVGILGYMSGIVVGYARNNSIISNCSTRGSLCGPGSVGGVVGKLENSNVDNCFSDATIIYDDDWGSKTTESFSWDFFGGIVGHAFETCNICNSGFAGEIDGGGGILGSVYYQGNVAISNCYAIFAGGDGICGYGNENRAHLIKNCFADIRQHDYDSRGERKQGGYGIGCAERIENCFAFVDGANNGIGGENVKNCYVVGEKIGEGGGEGFGINNTCDVCGCVTLIDRYLYEGSYRIIKQYDIANLKTIKNCYAWNNSKNYDGTTNWANKSTNEVNGADVSKSEFWGASTKKSFWIDKLGWTDFDENWEFRSGYNLPQLKGLPSIADPDYLTNAE